MVITSFGLLAAAAFPFVAALLAYCLVSGIEMIGLALTLTYGVGVSLYCDVAKHSREDWKEAVTTRDGRVIMALGAVTFLITITMMVGAYLQLF
jgi:hypothetical protein